MVVVVGRDDPVLVPFGFFLLSQLRSILVHSLVFAILYRWHPSGSRAKPSSSHLAVSRCSSERASEVDDEESSRKEGRK